MQVTEGNYSAILVGIVGAPTKVFCLAQFAVMETEGKYQGKLSNSEDVVTDYILRILKTDQTHFHGGEAGVSILGPI